MVSLADKVAIVTGAAQGIGQAYAAALAGAGASIVIADVDAPRGEVTAKSIADTGGAASFIAADVSSEAAVDMLVQSTLEQYGGVDILVNNAGVWGKAEKDRLATSLDAWNRMFAVNVTSMFLLSRAVAPTMIQRGGGAIINQSSIGAYLGSARMPHYSTSKGAVNALTKTLAKELGPHGIRVNAIAPGCIATEGTLAQMGREGVEAFLSLQCLKRIGETDDLTGPLLFLASDQSKFVTGQVLVVDGGVYLLG
jgi:NAD(P)-dependent dehydrogenase (short-subunit alcohol dehydrogenase family)